MQQHLARGHDGLREGQQDAGLLHQGATIGAQLRLCVPVYAILATGAVLELLVCEVESVMRKACVAHLIINRPP